MNPREPFPASSPFSLKRGRQMTKRTLLLCTANLVGVVLLGGAVCLAGSPVSGDSRGHMFRTGYLYLDSHQQASSFRVRQNKRAVGIEFGRCGYIWGRK